MSTIVAQAFITLDLAVYPLVLGSGKKLFSDGFALARLTLVETRALQSGVLVNTYQR
jgi:hypothetical protein